jgi:16S rRNA (guanine(966)-N(2))-methyltransferase RsmD
MGAEALCRGAAMVVGIEQAGRACGVIRENWQTVATPEQTLHVIQGDVVKRLSLLKGQQFDHIYFDPPYASEVYLPVLCAIAQLQLLAPTGELAVEHDPQRQFDDIVAETGDRLTICRQKGYGGTALTFFEVA